MHWPNTANIIIIDSYSFSIIYKCWKLSPDDRPPFEALTSAFNRHLQAVAGYMEVQMVLELQGNMTIIIIAFFNDHMVFVVAHIWVHKQGVLKW